MKSGTAPSLSPLEPTQPTREPEIRQPASAYIPPSKGSITTPDASPISARPSEPASKPAAKPVINQAPVDEEQIRRRAYELYVEGGYVDGNHDQDWYTAERELNPKDK
jgi:Protein of unknown function (DUF2934)